MEEKNLRILMLFIDMLGAQYINTCNENANITTIDVFLRSIGGTVYKKAYSPAPDTPRCAACMWTGMYPKMHFCNKRVKWPADSMNRDIDNIWDIFRSLDYTVNVFVSKCIQEIGLIPLTGNENVYYNTIDEFFSNAEITDDSFNFFYLPDLHYILGETGHEEWGLKEGLDFIAELIKKIIDYYNATNTFDYIIMCSDHGYNRAHKEYKHIINPDRSNTFMFVRKKDETALVIDDQLRSNNDIMPTICEIIGYELKNQIQGKSLLDTNGHDYVLIEDLENFYVQISQTVEHWCVVLSDGSFHWFECNGEWEHEYSAISFDEEYFKSILFANMSDLNRNLSLYNTSQKYQAYVRDFYEKNNYSNGEHFYHITYHYSDIELLKDKKIILYGAGKVGKDIYRQLLEKSVCSVMGWIDMNYEELRKNGNSNVNGITQIFEVDFDYILICIDNKLISKQISNLLIQLSVDEKKIISDGFVKFREK